MPPDTLTLTKLYDGTHNGNKAAECFINSANGFSGGDDTATDGIVCSGDQVGYRYTFTIAPGPERDLRLKFDASKAKDLDVSDFSHACVSSSIVTASWNSEDSSCSYHVPRGASTTVSGRLNFTAKDTQGSREGGNVLTGDLYSSASSSTKPIVVATTQPVTVISEPFADLTIDAATGRRTPGAVSEVYSQKDGGKGHFFIEAYKMHYPGWSSYGVADPGEWKTDIDVTDFCDLTKYGGAASATCPTTFSIKNADGTSTALTPVKSGSRWLLTGLSGTQRTELDYQLPTSILPNSNKPAVLKLQIHLLPHADSLASPTGEHNLVPDPGTGEPSSFNTANTTWHGQTIGAIPGYTLPNNNYGQSTITFDETAGKPGHSPYTADYAYGVYAPRDLNKSIYDTPTNVDSGSNIHWRSGENEDYSTQGRNLESMPSGYDHITNNNAMRSQVTFNTSTGVFAGMKDSSAIQVGVTWNFTQQAGKTQKAHFDTSLPVVVRYTAADGTSRIIDPSMYTAQWRQYKPTDDWSVTGNGTNDSNLRDSGDSNILSGWTTSQNPPNEEDNQLRLTFTKDAFPVGLATGGIVTVSAPVKAFSYSAQDQDKLIPSVATMQISASTISLNDGSSCTGGCSIHLRYERVPIAVATAAQLDTIITNTSVSQIMDGRAFTGYYDTRWHVTNSIIGSSVTGPFRPTVTLRLDSWLDPSHITVPAGWKVTSTKPDPSNTADTLVTIAATTDQQLSSRRDFDSAYLGQGLDVSIRTKAGLDVDSQSVGATATLADPNREGKELDSQPPESVAIAHFSLSQAAGAMIVADGHNLTEPGQDLGWNAYLLSGRLKHGDIWYDRIFLPRAGSTPAPTIAENTWLGYVSENAGWTANCNTTTRRDESGVYDEPCRSAYSGTYKLGSEGIKLVGNTAGVEVWYPVASGAANVSLPAEQKQWTNPASSENTIKGSQFDKANGSLSAGHVSYHKANIGSDGTLSFPDLASGEAPLAVYVRGTEQNASGGIENLRVRITLNAQDAKVGDTYVAWIGAMRTSENQTATPGFPNHWADWSTSSGSSTAYAYPKDSLPTPWPDDERIATASVSGMLWRDDNKDGVLNRDETGRYGHVAVRLLKKNADGNYVQAKTVDGNAVPDQWTNSLGAYSFTNIPHGDYRVQLVNVTREADSDLINSADGDTNSASNLKSHFTDRYSVARHTEETYSYNGKTGKNSASSADVTLTIGQALSGVNFGFFTPQPDASLDKSRGTVTPATDATKKHVTWTVTVGNTGNVNLTGPSLSDRMSASATNVSARLSYSTKATLNKAAVAYNPDGASSSLVTDKDGHLFAYRCTAGSGAARTCTFDELGIGNSTTPTAFFAGITPPSFDARHLTGTTAASDSLVHTYGAYFAASDGTLYRYDPRNSSAPVSKVIVQGNATFQPGLAVSAADADHGGMVLIADRQGRLHSFSMTSANSGDLAMFGSTKEGTYNSSEYADGTYRSYPSSMHLALIGTAPYRVILSDKTGHIVLLDISHEGAISSTATANDFGSSHPQTVISNNIFPIDTAIELDDQSVRDVQFPACIRGICYTPPTKGAGAVILTSNSGHVFSVFDYHNGSGANIWTIYPQTYGDNASSQLVVPGSHPAMSLYHPDIVGANDPTTSHIFYTDASGRLHALTRNYQDSVALIDTTISPSSTGITPTFKPGMMWEATAPDGSGNSATAVTDENGTLWNVIVDRDKTSGDAKFEQVTVDSAANVPTHTTTNPANIRLAPNTPLAASDGSPRAAALVSDSQGTTYELKYVSRHSNLTYTDCSLNGCWGPYYHSDDSGGYVLIPVSSLLRNTMQGGVESYPVLNSDQFIPIGGATLISDSRGTTWLASADVDEKPQQTKYPDISNVQEEISQLRNGKSGVVKGTLSITDTDQRMIALRAVPGLENEFKPNQIVADMGSGERSSNSTAPSEPENRWCFAAPDGSNGDGGLVCDGGNVHVAAPMQAIDSDITPNSYSQISNKDEGGGKQEWITRTYTDLPALKPGEKAVITFGADFPITAAAATSDGEIVGNQAWFTSTNTPRSGLRVAEKIGDDTLPAVSDGHYGNMTGTGEGIPAHSGIPDAPKLPASQKTYPDGFYYAAGIVHTDPQPSNGVSTCRTDANAPTDSATGHTPDSEPADDLCDQTPALITATKPPTPKTGTVTGFVWFDNVATTDLSGKVTHVSASNGIYQKDASDTTGADADEPASGVLVTVSPASDPTQQAGTAVSGADGTWSVTGLTAGTDYIVRYTPSSAHRSGQNGVTWYPVAQNVEKDTAGHNVDLPSTTATLADKTTGLNQKLDSDANESGIVTNPPDSTGTSYTYKSVEATDSGTPGRADMGLAASMSGLTVIKGAPNANGKVIEDIVSGTKRLTDTPTAKATDTVPAPDLSSTNCDNLPTNGKLEDGDNDPRTQAYALCIVNSGQSDVSGLQLTDSTLRGNPAVMSKTFTLYRSNAGTLTTAGTYQWHAASGTPSDANYVAAGFYRITGSGSSTSIDTKSPLVLHAGDILAGAVDVPFTYGKAIHEDRVTARGAAALPSGSSSTTSVDAAGTLLTRYDVTAYRLRLRKIASTSRAPLQGATFTLTPCNVLTGGSQPVTLPNGEGTSLNCQATPVSHVTTDANGLATTDPIGSGTYEVREANTPNGYSAPAGVWYTRLDFQQTIDGGRVKTISLGKSSSGDPSASASADPIESLDWGEITIPNTTADYFRRMPMTGLTGRDWILLGLLLLLIAAVGWGIAKAQDAVYRKRVYKTSLGHDLRKKGGRA